MLKILIPLVSAFVLIGSGDQRSSSPLTEVEPAVGAIEVVETNYFEVGGSEYHPSEGQGNVLFLLKSSEVALDSCFVPLADGSVAPLVQQKEAPESTNSYAGYQTWQVRVRCTSLAEIRVQCLQGERRIVYTVADDAQDEVCAHFG